MRPNEHGGGAGQQYAPAVVVNGKDTTNDQQFEEKPALPAAALDEVIAMRGDLSKRMCRTEFSQN